MSNSMTIQEVIKRLKVSKGIVTAEVNNLDDKNIGGAFDLAVEALEKQIPKKPLAPISKLLEMGKCPNCNASLFDKNLKFCTDCGQALDWSDE